MSKQRFGYGADDYEGDSESEIPEKTVSGYDVPGITASAAQPFIKKRIRLDPVFQKNFQVGGGNIMDKKDSTMVFVNYYKKKEIPIGPKNYIIDPSVSSC